MRRLSVLLPIAVAASLPLADSLAEEALSNLSAESDFGQLQTPGSGITFARMFATGAERTSLSSVVLEHFLFDPIQTENFSVNIYRAYYLPGSSDPTLELAGVLTQYEPSATAYGVQSLNTLVAYYPSSLLVLEPNSLYAVGAAEAGDNQLGPTMQFTAFEAAQTALPGWQMGEELVGFDSYGFQFWMPAWDPLYLKFALNVEPASPLNSPPDVSRAYASVATVWPPNGKMVPFKIQGVTDPDGDPVSIEITQVLQTEPVRGPKDKTAPDAVIARLGTGKVRAERLASGPGRLYAVLFTASDGKPGGVADGVAFIVVPHDLGPGAFPVDPATASYFDSTARY